MVFSRSEGYLSGLNGYGDGPNLSLPSLLLKRSNTLLVTVYLTWMSTICVVVMATYGRTLCWEKRNTVPNTGGVFAVGAI